MLSVPPNTILSQIIGWVLIVGTILLGLLVYGILTGFSDGQEK